MLATSVDSDHTVQAGLSLGWSHKSYDNRLS